MKKIIINILLLSIIPLSAQQITTLSYDGSRLLNHTFYQNGDSSSKGINYEDIQGTPYYDQVFSLAKFIITDKAETALARYNTYFDEIEFKKDEETYSLAPNSPFNRIEFTRTKETLVKLDTGDDLTGYFFELANGKNSLYKKVKSEFKKAVTARNSYELDRPASFVALAPAYYIKTEQGYIIKRPRKINDILEILPSQKKDIETFVKSNNIKLNKEEDLIKLINFLNR
ncbi:hypothetical protein HX13_08520 [Chryseobacterium sp. P1-3]|uniref:hypothetical protein n=1 Tax=Chryseobacterium sp. (strain P1-3) TaxID=1517683 RepID=UPI0004E76C83|nr:hypothetical protein [Chryseobacterium sp. P1-3]KFF75222.1 hypothetical protein HX13_08520 [Chryseobacterium sp. P1-3]